MSTPTPVVPKINLDLKPKPESKEAVEARWATECTNVLENFNRMQDLDLAIKSGKATMEMQLEYNYKMKLVKERLTPKVESKESVEARWATECAKIHENFNRMKDIEYAIESGKATMDMRFEYNYKMKLVEARLPGARPLEQMKSTSQLAEENKVVIKSKP